uniref:OTU domain-containing protein n=1 Tax=viral metagenome TaxID=1070528 RepID=A0A6C0HIE0_9ZZZZ
MVSSKLNDSINYKENRTIEDGDLGASSVVYEMEIEDRAINFVLGKQKYTYAGKNVLYYPIYLLNENRIKAQIGVFELKSNQALNILDDDGDVDLNVLEEPLLYSFVTSAFLDKALKPKIVPVKEIAQEEDTDDENEHLKSASSKAKSEKDEPAGLEEGEIDESGEVSDDDETDPTSLKVPDSVHAEQAKSLKEKTKNGLLEINEDYQHPALLKEEDAKDDKEIKAEFKENEKQPWIQKYMKNPNYEIVEVESNGNCFFASVREAFRSIGYKTTVDKLRSALAREMPERIFTDQLELFNVYQSNINELESRINAIKKENAEYKKRIKKATLEEREEILKRGAELAKETKEKQKEKADAEHDQQLYVGYMSKIKTIDQYRDYIQTPSFWADAWAISTIERLLNIKVIIMSQMAYNDGAMHGVLNCGEINKQIQDRGVFNPDYYIIVTYSGNHYRLITYKGKRIFTFREIPYGIKVLVVNKCLEKNAGSFYLIEDFRNFKARQGIHPDTGNPKKSEEEADADELNRDLYDDDTVFMFHQHSELSAKPGKGSGEKIAVEKIPQFSDLAKTKEWRRMLDDTWPGVVLSVDNLKWMSAEHYIQAAKFKGGFPDFYKSFSIESESDISKDVEYAKAAGESGKLKKKPADGGKAKEIVLRAKEIHSDENYDADEVRKMAIHAKFSQNEDVKQVLLATKKAKLLHFSRGTAGNTIDIPLMELRRKLTTA